MSGPGESPGKSHPNPQHEMMEPFGKMITNPFNSPVPHMSFTHPPAHPLSRSLSPCARGQIEINLLGINIVNALPAPPTHSVTLMYPRQLFSPHPPTLLLPQWFISLDPFTTSLVVGHPTPTNSGEIRCLSIYGRCPFEQQQHKSPSKQTFFWTNKHPVTSGLLASLCDTSPTHTECEGRNR